MTILLLTLLPLLFPFTVFSKDILIEYKAYNYDRKSGFHYYQSPRVKLEGSTITGQSAEFNKLTNIMTFQGNIIIYSSEMLLTADKALVDLKNSVYTLFDATFFDQKNNAYGKAEKIEQVDEGTYVIYKGEVSTCNPANKAWDLSSSRIVYQVDQYAYSINSILFFYSFPIFYTPFLAWPTKEGRATGMLPPVLSSSSNSDETKEYGSRLQLPYFIALDRDHDLTLTADLIEKRGLGLDLDYQYAFFKHMRGEIKLWYLDESVEDRDLDLEYLGSLSRDDESIDLQPTRYKYSISHRQDLFWNGALTINRYGISDNEISKEYFDQESHLNNQYNQSLDLSFPMGSGSFSLAYTTTAKFLETSIYDRETDEETHVNKHPSVSVTQQYPAIAGTPVSVSLSGGWAVLERIYGWNSEQTTGGLRVSSPFTLDFLSIAPMFQRTYYRHNPRYSFRSGEEKTSTIDGDPDEFGWKKDRSELELSFEVFRYFTNDNVENYGKLSFVPRVIYVEVDDVHISQPTGFDLAGAGVSQKSLTYRLDTVYKVKNLQTNAVRDFFHLSFIQPFDLNSVNCAQSSDSAPRYCVKNHPANPEVEIGEQKLPLRIHAVLRPTAALTGSLFYRYNHQENQFVETRISLGSTYRNGSKFTLSYIDNTKHYRDLDNVNHPGAKTYAITNSMFLSSRSNLLLEGKWDQARSELNNRFTDGSIERLDRSLTSLSAAYIYKHYCYTWSLAYSEKVKVNSDESKEYLDKKFVFSLSIPLIPSARSSGLGEFSLKDDVRFE